MKPVKCAAIKWPDGYITTGSDHGACIPTGMPPDVIKFASMGFVDTEGNFLTRREAYDRAVEHGQIEVDGGERLLTSEMLRHKGKPYDPSNP